MRQEQVVFVAGALVLALLTAGLYRGDAATPRIPRGGGAEVERERFPAPDVDAVLPDVAVAPEGRRALFAPPRDTRPLPPLPLVEPPRPELAGLLPPTAPGPAPAVYGELLRRPSVLQPTPDLFAVPVDPLAVGDASEGAFDPFFDGEDGAEAGGGRDEDDAQGRRGGSDPYLDESPAEREARFAGYRQRYDWVSRRTGSTLFGRIENEDRYGLRESARASEQLLFVEVDPETGVEALASVGAVPVPIERSAIADFGFAETVPNQLAARARELGDAVTRGTYDERLEFAAWAVENRLEADAALGTAQRVYRALAAFDPDDPEPRLGLARALEAGFLFDEALQEYGRIVSDFPLEAAAHVGLAQLEARFLLYDQAEERLRQAVSIDRGSWQARRALGRFLYQRGRHEEAVEHLEAANRAAPNDPDALTVRVGIRDDLGTALLAVGDVEGAARAFASAASADAGDQRALAGRMVCAVLADPLGGAEAARALYDGADVDEPGFELALASGLTAIAAGDGATAERELRSAVTLDPLRATLPLAALAHVAHGTGYPDEALELAEAALEADPGNAYAYYLRGRLLGERDAYDEARDALVSALDVELDFEDALVAMADIAFRIGRFEDAERYLERAVDLADGPGGEDARPEVLGLRGLNLLRLERVGEARAAFEAARAVDPVDPVALAGLAWCTYLSGDPTEALVQLADLDEARRELPEDDPWREWARAQQERIAAHTAKEEWFDTLNRKTLKNGWITEEKDGPTSRMVDGAVALEGPFDRQGVARVYRTVPAGLFVSFEASVWIEPTNVRAGIFVARERSRSGDTEVTDEVSVSRHKDGATQVRVVRARQRPDEVDMEAPFPTGRWVRLRIEREGEGAEAVVTVSLDGVPLLENLGMPALASGTSPLLMGLFVEGEVGREAAIRMDDVSVVRRLR